MIDLHTLFKHLSLVCCPLSLTCCPWHYRYPILLDAVASEMQRKGDSMMSKWAEVMTNIQPKTYFFRPHIALLPLGVAYVAIVCEFLAQKVFGKPDRYQLKATK